MRDLARDMLHDLPDAILAAAAVAAFVSMVAVWAAYGVGL